MLSKTFFFEEFCKESEIEGSQGMLWPVMYHHVMYQTRIVLSFPSSPADGFALLGLHFLVSSPAGISLGLNLCKYRSTEVSCIVQNRSQGMKMLVLLVA